MPTIVFDVSEKDAMLRAVLGEQVGTFVHAG
jgi:uridylate kinase